MSESFTNEVHLMLCQSLYLGYMAIRTLCGIRGLLVFP